MPGAVSAGSSHIEFLERVIETTTSSLLDLARQVLDAMGPKPARYTAGDPLTQCEEYLRFRDDPSAWKAKVEENAALYGLEAAEAWAIVEANRLEKMLAHRGGQEGVLAAKFMGRLRKAEKALGKAQDIEAMPKFHVNPPNKPMSQLDLLREVNEWGEREEPARYATIEQTLGPEPGGGPLLGPPAPGGPTPATGGGPIEPPPPPASPVALLPPVAP